MLILSLILSLLSIPILPFAIQPSNGNQSKCESIHRLITSSCCSTFHFPPPLLHGRWIQSITIDSPVGAAKTLRLINDLNNANATTELNNENVTWKIHSICLLFRALDCFFHLFQSRFFNCIRPATTIRPLMQSIVNLIHF